MRFDEEKKNCLLVKRKENEKCEHREHKRKRIRPMMMKAKEESY
jgi:hypothetical protein